MRAKKKSVSGGPRSAASEAVVIAAAPVTPEGKNDGGPALVAIEIASGVVRLSSQLTVRDYFAAQSLPRAVDYRPASITQWLRRLFGLGYAARTVVPEEAAKSAYRISDAMLAERAK